MSIWGIGPILGMVGTVTFIGSMMIGWQSGFTQYGFLGRDTAVAAGIALLTIGLVFYGNSVYLIVTRFRAGKLIRAGVFRIVRNPMYCAFILFFMPGVSLLVDNWLVLATSLTVFAAFKLCIHREERFLESVFGDEYIQYVKEVKQIIPFIV